MGYLVFLEGVVLFARPRDGTLAENIHERKAVAPHDMFGLSSFGHSRADMLCYNRQDTILSFRAMRNPHSSLSSHNLNAVSMPLASDCC